MTPVYREMEFINGVDGYAGPDRLFEIEYTWVTEDETYLEVNWTQSFEPFLDTPQSVPTRGPKWSDDPLNNFETLQWFDQHQSLIERRIRELDEADDLKRRNA